MTMPNSKIFLAHLRLLLWQHLHHQPLHYRRCYHLLHLSKNHLHLIWIITGILFINTYINKSSSSSSKIRRGRLFTCNHHIISKDKTSFKLKKNIYIPLLYLLATLHNLLFTKKPHIYNNKLAFWSFSLSLHVTPLLFLFFPYIIKLIIQLYNIHYMIYNFYYPPPMLFIRFFILWWLFNFNLHLIRSFDPGFKIMR